MVPTRQQCVECEFYQECMTDFYNEYGQAYDFDEYMQNEECPKQD